jgi:hypothetical protein
MQSVRAVMEYYTYAFLREDGTPYYIGKGKGYRIYDKKGRPCNLPPKERIIKLKKNLTEEEAFRHEKYMISVFGRKDLGTGILRNRTNGGEGPSGVLVSKETRKKLSELRKCKYSGEKNPMYGKSHSEEVRKRMSESHKGKLIPEEVRKRMSKSHKDKSHSTERKRKMSESKKGRKWWNDGCGNTKFVVECPGDGWFPGRNEEVKRKHSETVKGEKNHNYGKKWWNDGCGNNKMSVECPGEGWVLGMMKKGHFLNRHTDT